MEISEDLSGVTMKEAVWQKRHPSTPSIQTLPVLVTECNFHRDDFLPVARGRGTQCDLFVYRKLSESLRAGWETDTQDSSERKPMVGHLSIQLVVSVSM